MNLTNLKPAADHEVQKWLEESLELTQYQKSLIYNNELIRWGPFDFYKDRNKEKSSGWWRLTLLLFPIYWILLIVAMPLKFIMTGKWGYNQKFVDKYYHSWCRKLNIN